MTRKEALKILKKCCDRGVNRTIYAYDEYVTARDMAIKALEQEPCEDAISREAVQDLIATWLSDYLTDETREVLETIDCKIGDMPSVYPKQKTGHWILTDDDFVYCSECGDSYYPRPIDASWYYCPHCGAKMIESQESEE